MPLCYSAAEMARYELLERIGVGGMAEIFRGTAIAGSGFEKPVAIKRILPHLSEDQRFIELLIAEAKILSELHHRNIVQIFDVGVGDDGQYFLVMEFVDGTDLKHIYEHLFDGRRLPVEVALHICSELLEALEHAHNAKGVDGTSLRLVHRDVSPSNVLLSKSGEVKLTDFGIAKRVEEVTGHGGVRGKFAYISPEQAMNKRVDGRSDVYSLGILLYELVCGRRLFSAMADFDALREVREGRVRPSAKDVPNVEPKLAGLIMRALSVNPDDRFPSAGEFGSELRSYRYGLDTTIADPGKEIADLVKREGKAPERLPPPADDGFSFDDGGSKVVRIDTAAEFNLTDLSGLHQLVSSFPEPKIYTGDEVSGDFDEMKTSTIDAAGLAKLMPQTPGLGEPKLKPTVVGHRASSEIDDEMTMASTPVRDFSSSEEEPTVMHHSRSDLAFNDQLIPEVGAVAEEIFGKNNNNPAANRPPAAEPISGSQPLVALSAPGQPPNGPIFARAATPTDKDVFHSHAIQPGLGIVPNHYPGYGGRAPTALEQETRRRKIQMGLVGGALAVLAFVIAGHFLGSDESAPGASLDVDAGLVIDAGPAMDDGDATSPSSEEDAGAKKSRNQRNRKNRKNRRRNKNRKKKKGNRGR